MELMEGLFANATPRMDAGISLFRGFVVMTVLLLLLLCPEPIKNPMTGYIVSIKVHATEAMGHV